MRPVNPSDPRLAHHVLTRSDVSLYCILAGFRGEALVTAIAVAQAESSFDAGARNPSRAGERAPNGDTWGDTVGLFQVRVLDNPSRATGLDRKRDLYAMVDPRQNAAFAYQLSSGGRSFQPWTAYTSGTYKKYVAAARVEALRQRPGLPGGVDAAQSVNPISADTWIDNTSPVLPVQVGGGAGRGDIGNSVVRASVDYSMGEASQAELEVEDENADLLRTSSGFDEGSSLLISGVKHIITSVGIKQGPGSPHFVLRSQPAGVVKLRGVTPTDAAGTTALDYVHGMARAAGMQFVGGPPSPSVDVIVGTVALAGTPTTTTLDPLAGLTQGSRKENAWEVARRLASESTGYVCFESAGTLYFATQDWLYTNTGVLYVQVGNASFNTATAGTAVRSIGYPSITRTIKRDGQNAAYQHVEATMDLPPGPGYAAKPGMRLWLAEPSGIVRDARPMLIQQVTIALGDQTQTVRVVAASYTAPGDVEAQPGTVDGSGATGGATANLGTARAVDFVRFAASQKGDRYVFGAEARLDDPNPDAFDCSELVQWAAARAGVTVPDGSGAQKAFCQRKGKQISIAAAARTPGALLFLGLPTPHHVAISMGNGKTIEARGRAYGVGNFNIAGRFDSAFLMPGLNYEISTARANSITVPHGAAPTGG